MKKKIIVVVIVLILGLTGFGYYSHNKVVNGGNDNNKTPNYTIKYDDGGIPGNSYDIYIYDNINIKVVKHPGCSTVECIEGTYKPSDEEYELNYSDDLKNKLSNEYFTKIFATSNHITVSHYDETLNEETNKFIYAVIYKNESNL